MRYIISFLLIGIFLNACFTDCKPNTFGIVYKNDKEGNALIGCKDNLIKYIRGGSEIRIGWGAQGESHTIEHLSEPIWIAVLDDSEVIVHLDAQVLSKIDWDNLTATYSDSTLLNQEWRVVLTTKGEFDAVWYDRRGGEVTRRRPQNHIITWYAKGSPSGVPLFSSTND